MNDLLKNKNICIIGLGLLGTSLGLALRNKSCHVMGWGRRAEVREYALNINAISETAQEVKDLLAKADLTIICLPIPTIISFIKEHAHDFKAGSTVTDIGSVKQVIVEAGERELSPNGVNFIGSHPMAGTEKSGAYAAFASLYQHAEVFVTPTENSNAEAIDLVVALWKDIDTSVKIIAPLPHDELVAHTSHISHLLALGLTLSVLEDNTPELQKLRFSGCATGFRDTSRIVSSSPTMWREIIEANQPAVLQSMAEFNHYFTIIQQLISEGRFDEFEALFACGKTLRDSWINYKNREHNCNW